MLFLSQPTYFSFIKTFLENQENYIMKYFIIFAIGLFLHYSTAMAESLNRDCFYASEEIQKEIGYCQAVRSGNTLYISGSTGSGDMPTAIAQSYGVLRATLEHYGLGFDNVVKETVYSTNLDAFIEHKDLRKAYFGDLYPSSTWVQIDRLYLPSIVLEVEFIAIFPDQ